MVSIFSNVSGYLPSVEARAQKAMVHLAQPLMRLIYIYPYQPRTWTCLEAMHLSSLYLFSSNIGRIDQSDV
jgi:hypothetical protein